MSKIRIIVVLLIFGLGVGSVTAASFFGYLTLPGNANPTKVNFVIIITDQGMNGSRVHYNIDSWPIVNVAKGSLVTISVSNVDTAEPHGFAVDSYETGITLRPGDTVNVTFVADRAGSFRVFCSIPCSIHIYMQNGRLNVV